MAYVAISQDFLARVSNKISSMEQAEMSSIGQETPIMLSSNTPSVLKAVWGEHLHLKQLVPDAWTGEMESLQAKIVLDDNTEHKFEHMFNVGLTEKIRTPPGFYKYHHHLVDHTAPEYASKVEWIMKKRDINFRWRKVQVQVRSFLENCKSANEAVKLWPDVKMYFDNNDIKRLDTKASRASSEASNAASILAQMDTTELVGAAVIARMSGA